VGKETLLPGFQEQLVGARKGQTVEFSLLLPEAGSAEETPPITADFRVTVHDLAHKEVPLLDDEFAKDHGECETLEELRVKIRENLDQIAKRRAEGQMHEDLMDQLLSRNPFDVPPGLIHEQTQQLLVEAGVQRPENASSPETMIPESVREGFSQRAKRQIQTTVILDTLAEQLGLTMTVEEVDQKAAEFASASVEHRQQIEAFYADSANRRMLEGRLLREKALQAAVEKASVRMAAKGVAGDQEKD
jgi:trigger factor